MELELGCALPNAGVGTARGSSGIRALNHKTVAPAPGDAFSLCVYYISTLHPPVFYLSALRMNFTRWPRMRLGLKAARTAVIVTRQGQDSAGLEGCFLSSVRSPAQHKLGGAAHICNPNPEKVEAEGSGVQSHP